MRDLRFLILLAVCLRPDGAGAQWLDAELPRRGELQVGIGGHDIASDHRFSPNGEAQPFTEVFGAVLDARLVPPLSDLDAVLGTVFSDLGLGTPEPASLGALRYDVLLERTRAPIDITYAATRWLAASVRVPIVHGRSFVEPRLDSLVASAGQGSTAFGGDPTGFLSNLGGGIAALQSMVAADTLPPERQARAEALLADARAMQSGLVELSDLQYLPTDSSASGRALAGAYGDVRSGFDEFGVELPGLSLADPLAREEAEALLATADLGNAPPENTSTGIKFGDIELGISLQPINTFRPAPGEPRSRIPLRARLDAIWRLPTGDAPRPTRLTDVGTGDGLADLELRSTLDVGYGRTVWLSLFAGYNIQFEGTVTRLITSPQAPLQPGSFTTQVSWDPGDELVLAVAPRLNLTRVITFSGFYGVTRHMRDRVQAQGTVPPDAAFRPERLEEGSEYTARRVGFAARYSSTEWHGGRRHGASVEVELRYRRTVGARDGYVPRWNVWEVGIRLYRTLFP